MKLLRAEGIAKLILLADADLEHLARLSRGDEALQEAFTKAQDELTPAEGRVSEIIDNLGENEDA